jgi:hypothetical protein
LHYHSDKADILNTIVILNPQTVLKNHLDITSL